MHYLQDSCSLGKRKQCVCPKSNKHTIKTLSLERWFMKLRDNHTDALECSCVVVKDTSMRIIPHKFKPRQMKHVSVAHYFGLVSRVLKGSRLIGFNCCVYLIIYDIMRGAEMKTAKTMLQKFTFSHSAFIYLFFLLHLIYEGSYFCITNPHPLLISGKDSRQ